MSNIKLAGAAATSDLFGVISSSAVMLSKGVSSIAELADAGHYAAKAYSARIKADNRINGAQRLKLHVSAQSHAIAQEQVAIYDAMDSNPKVKAVYDEIMAHNEPLLDDLIQELFAS